MDALRAALGVSADAGVGDAVHASLGDAGTLDGVVDYSTPEFLGVRTADGLYRFFGRNHYGSVVGMSAHLFVRRRRRRGARGGAQGVAGRGVRVGRRMAGGRPAVHLAP